MAGFNPTQLARCALTLTILLIIIIPGGLISAAVLILLKYFGIDLFEMEQQATHLLAVSKNAHVPLETKLDLLIKLKTYIKHHHVPESAIAPAFDVVRFAISNSQLLDAGFSILSHLTKRLELQEQLPLTAAQGKKTYPIILERLGDAKDRVRLRAIQALTEFWKASHTDVEQLIRDSALSGKSPRVKEAAMQWILKMNMEFSLQFKGFVAKLVECLQDADGGVRDTAKSTIVELFLHASEAAKSDLKKQLEMHKVRKATVTHIYTQLGLSIPPEIETTSSSHAQGNESSSTHKTLDSPIGKILPTSITLDETMPAPVNSHSGTEAYKLDPIFINSSRELDEMVRSMLPFFEGKEVEDNWIPREKSIIKLRRITKGNAPLAYNTTYILSIKLMLDGILKTVNSLRTTVSTNGCHLIQDIARAAGTGLDGMVEILLQSLIKLCGGTKTISAQNSNETVDAIFANVTYNVRIMQHIWVACQDKNVRPRSYATGWLKTLITKHGHHKSILEHANGLDIIDKCIKKGLADANPGVRESMRATYWAYWRVWSDRADSLMQSLEVKQQALLLKVSSNPNPSGIPVDTTAIAGPRATAFSRSATTAPRGPSLKEAIAARKMEARLAERPGSAQSSASPTRPVLPRPATSMAIGSLSSAPLRPIRTKVPPKKNNSPSVSPSKSKLRTVVPELAACQQEKDRPRSSPNKPITLKENIPPRKAALGKSAIETGNQVAKARASPLSSYASTEFKPKVPQTELPKRVIIYKDSISSPGAASRDSVNGPSADSQPIKTTPTRDAENMTLVLPVLARSVDSSGSPMSPSRILGPNESESGMPAKLVAADEAVLGPNGGESPRFVLRERPLNLEASSKQVAVAPNPAVSPNLYHSHCSADLKMIQSGIARIRAQTLDPHGFRKLQELLTHRETFWTDNPDTASKYRLDELFEALVGALEIKDELKMRTHLLRTIRLMAISFPTTLGDRVVSSLFVLLRTRGSYPPQSHLLDEHRETVLVLLKLTAKGEYVTLTLKKLTQSVENPETCDTDEILMCLRCLCGLMRLDTHSIRNERHPLDIVWQSRLAKALLVLIESEHPRVRQHSMACVVELHDMAGAPEWFWPLIECASVEHRSLIHYFVALCRENAAVWKARASGIGAEFHGSDILDD
ncbi:suppressor of tub2 mutation [Trapelia coarctata]|nr:suppressor of tub2 mutation [Trapelia coarctata]